MRTMLIGTLAAITVCGAAMPALGQARVDRMMRQMDETMVALLETALRDRTNQNATIIYVKKFPGLYDQARYCGIARIGATRQRFVIDMSESLLVMQPSQRVWTEASCETNPPNTTILRDER
ncbi:hypothetical protein [Brevundimonas nasdae]|uniref:hypothetical protein n=1 Tax=Brevundimonas nasdae TaxID=172043 RepID=UPI003F6937B3